MFVRGRYRSGGDECPVWILRSPRCLWQEIRVQAKWLVYSGPLNHTHMSFHIDSGTRTSQKMPHLMEVHHAGLASGEGS